MKQVQRKVIQVHNSYFHSRRRQVDPVRNEQGPDSMLWNSTMCVEQIEKNNSRENKSRSTKNVQTNMLREDVMHRRSKLIV
jgi:hypothetical protein